LVSAQGLQSFLRPTDLVPLVPWFASFQLFSLSSLKVRAEFRIMLMSTILLLLHFESMMYEIVDFDGACSFKSIEQCSKSLLVDVWTRLLLPFPCGGSL
jgi:hypothetical protein